MHLQTTSSRISLLLLSLSCALSCTLSACSTPDDLIPVIPEPRSGPGALDPLQREVLNPLGNWAIVRDPLSQRGRLLKLESGELRSDQDYLTFSPDGKQVLFRPSLEQEIGFGILNLESGETQHLAPKGLKNLVAGDHTRVLWLQYDQILLGQNISEGQFENARDTAILYHLNPQDGTLQEWLRFPSPDPNGFAYWPHQAGVLLTRYDAQNEVDTLLQVQAQDTEKVLYRSEKNQHLEILALNPERVIFSETGSDSAQILSLPLNQEAAQPKILATSQNELETFGPAALSPEETLCYSVNTASGRDMRGRLPFNTKSLIHCQKTDQVWQSPPLDSSPSRLVFSDHDLVASESQKLAHFQPSF